MFCFVFPPTQKVFLKPFCHILLASPSEQGVIRIIRSNYGRLDQNTCTDTPSIHTFCTAGGFEEEVKSRYVEKWSNFPDSGWRELILNPADSFFPSTGATVEKSVQFQAILKGGKCFHTVMNPPSMCTCPTSVKHRISTQWTPTVGVQEPWRWRISPASERGTLFQI